MSVGLGGIVAGLLTNPLETVQKIIMGAGAAFDGAVGSTDGKQKDAQPGTDMKFGEQEGQNKTDLAF